MNRRTKIKIGLAVFIGAVIYVGTSAPTFALSRAEVKQIIVEEAHNSSVPPALALAVAKVESDFNPSALSSAGARGVMQIMPKTAKGEFGVDKNELWQARLNIQLGIDYLAKLHRQYGGKWDLALSHYNGGTLKGRGSAAKPHSYTKNYVRLVKRWQQRYADQNKVWAVAFNDTQRSPTNKWRPVNFDQVSHPDDKDRSWRKKSNKVRVTVKWQDGPAQKQKNWITEPGSELEERRARASRTLDDFSAEPRQLEKWLNG